MEKTNTPQRVEQPGAVKLTAEIPAIKHLVLVAHDNCKEELIEWASFNKGTLSRHHLYATGTTGGLLQSRLGLPVQRFLSGPLGGDQQIGAWIAEGKLDGLVFFWDPLTAQPHDPDVKALIRLATVYNIPVALNRASADFLISSPLMTGTYHRQLPDFAKRLGR
jgi:methylglyoxal synthase